MGRQRGHDLLAETGQHVDDPSRQIAHGQHLTQGDRRIRLCFRGERDHDIAANDRRQDDRHEREQRRLVGRQQPDHPHGLSHGEVEVRRGHRVDAAEQLLIFVAPTRIVHDAVDGGRHFLRGCGGLGATQGQGVDELGAARLEHLRQAIKDLPAVIARAACPTRHGARGSLDGVAQIFAGALRDVPDEIARGIVERKYPPALRSDELSTHITLRRFGNR